MRKITIPFATLIRKLKAPICELEFALSTKRVIGLIGTEKSCPMIVEINSNSIDGQTRPVHSCCNSSCCNCRCRLAAPKGTGSVNGCALSCDPNSRSFTAPVKERKKYSEARPSEIAGKLLSASPVHSGGDDYHTMISFTV